MKAVGRIDVSSSAFSPNPERGSWGAWTLGSCSRRAAWLVGAAGLVRSAALVRAAVRAVGLLVVVCAPTLSGCASPIDVRSAYDASVRFEDFRSFAMMQPNKPLPTSSKLGPFVLQRLRQLTYLQLTEQGLRGQDKKEAQLLVNVTAERERRVETYMRGGPGGYGFIGAYPGWGYPGYWGPAWSYDVREYDEGEVVIDLVDSRSNAVVWRGVGRLRLDAGVDDERLHMLVERILSLYPPAAQSPRGDEGARAEQR